MGPVTNAHGAQSVRDNNATHWSEPRVPTKNLIQV